MLPSRKQRAELHVTAALTEHSLIAADSQGLLLPHNLSSPGLHPKIPWEGQLQESDTSLLSLPPAETDAPASGSRWMVLPNGTLAIAQAALQDGGQYRCTATNALGTAQLLATLAVVAYPPRIAGGTRLLTAHAGVPVTMRCPAEGRPPPSISWVLANETHISSSSQGNQKVLVWPDGTLMIKDVTVYDRGLYTCTATNPAGTDTLTVKLQVIAAPPIILEEKRQQITAMAGQDLNLPCTAEGNPQPHVHWVLAKGTVVKPLQFVNTRVLMLPNGTLRLSSIAPTDSGNYECIATSSTGSERRVVILTVPHRDTLPRIGPVRGISGESLSLHCLSDGNPKPSTAWTLPGGQVLDRPQINTTIHDRGHYVCKAHNPAGDLSITIPVTIIAYPPRITNRPPQTIHTMPGAAVQLSCTALGIPKPEITWELPDHSTLSTGKHGRAPGSELLHPQGTLLIRNPQPSDSGTYKCTAKNHLGSDFTVTYIHVI
uniref:Immunoglobulin superfamily member 10 n=1 Tax=Coturnix japonica TaxID=93934 RepID=A0A8C2U3R1_COTJA